MGEMILGIDFLHSKVWLLIQVYLHNFSKYVGLLLIN